MVPRTRSEAEKSLAESLARHHRSEHGASPESLTVHLCGDLAIVRSRGVWTAQERELLLDLEHRKIVTASRHDHRALTRAAVHRLVSETLGCEVLRSFYDLDVRTGEANEVYVLECDLDRRLPA